MVMSAHNSTFAGDVTLIKETVGLTVTSPYPICLHSTIVGKTSVSLTVQMLKNILIHEVVFFNQNIKYVKYKISAKMCKTDCCTCIGLKWIVD